MKPKDKVRLLDAVEYPHMGFLRLRVQAGSFAIVDKVDVGPGVLLAFYDSATRQTTYGWASRTKLEVVP